MKTLKFVRIYYDNQAATEDRTMSNNSNTCTQQNQRNQLSEYYWTMNLRLNGPTKFVLSSQIDK